jgi:hypothetical protein
MGAVVSSIHRNKALGLCLSTLIFGILLQSSVFAEERQGLRLNAGLAVKNDSNITRTAEKTSDKSAVFSPRIQLLSNFGQHKLVFDYQGNFAVYNDNSQYNYNDHDFKLAALFDHSYRVDSELTLSYQDKVEEPGSNSAETQLNNEFNHLTSKTAQAKLYYGTRASSGQIVLGLSHNQRRYANNEQSYRNLDENKLTGTFFYRIAPKTRFLLETSVAKFNYIPDTLFTDRTSDENSFLAGVEWEATAITSGTFKMGYQQKNYEDVRFNDLDGLSYFLDMIWKPNTYTKIKIGASQSTDESAQQDVGGFISTGYSLAVSHTFSPRTIFNAKYEQDKSDLTFTQDRTDKRKSIKVGIVHGLRTWLDISLDYRHIARISNDNIYDFSSDSVELSLKTKFE